MSFARAAEHIPARTQGVGSFFGAQAAPMSTSRLPMGITRNNGVMTKEILPVRFSQLEGAEAA
jgi:hypothetical protein